MRIQSIEKVREVLNNKLYERKNRGILEFTWGKEDADRAQEAYTTACKKLKTFGINNIDIQPMSQRIIVVLTQDQEPIVTEVMLDNGFQLINKLFDPSKAEGVPSWYNPTLPHNR